MVLSPTGGLNVLSLDDSYLDIAVDLCENFHFASVYRRGLKAIGSERWRRGKTKFGQTLWPRRSHVEAVGS